MSLATRVLASTVVALSLLARAAEGEAEVHVALLDHRQPTFFSCATNIPYPPGTTHWMQHNLDYATGLSSGIVVTGN